MRIGLAGKQRWDRSPKLWVRLDRPQEQRISRQELLGKSLTIAIPELFLGADSHDGPTQQADERQRKWIVEPHHGVGTSPNEVADLE